MNRWAENGVLVRASEKLQPEQIVRIRIGAFCLDSTIVKVHADGTGAIEKRTTGHREITSRLNPLGFIWLPRVFEQPRPSGVLS